jgi:hypothetical protein
MGEPRETDLLNSSSVMQQYDQAEVADAGEGVITFSSSSV